MDPLDKLIRKFLNTRETIPYRERYWKDLEDSLDAQRHRRRPGVIYWRFGILTGLILLLTALLFFVPLSNDNAEEKAPPLRTIEPEIPVAETEAQSEQPDNKEITAGSNETASLSTQERITGGQASSGNNRTSKADQDTQNSLSGIATTTETSENSGITYSHDKAQVQPVAGNAKDENTIDGVSQSLVYSAHHDNDITDPIPQIPGTINWLRHITIPDAEPLLPEPVRQPFKKGIVIAVAAYGDFSAGQASLSRSPGFGLGTQIEFSLSRKLALTTEFGAHLHQGGFAFRKRSEQVALGFRATGTQYELDLHTLYQVYGATGLTYTFGRQSIYGGLGMNYTVAGKGEIHSADLASPAAVESVNSWLSLDGLQRFQPDVRVYYGYQINKRVGLMLGLQYQPGKLIDASGSSNAGYTFSGNRSKVYPRVGLNFDIIKPVGK